MADAGDGGSNVGVPDVVAVPPVVEAAASVDGVSASEFSGFIREVAGQCLDVGPSVIECV